MSVKPERNAFDRYMLEGGFEADARKGVAEARANLVAKGITPRDSSNVTPFPLVADALSLHAGR